MLGHQWGLTVLVDHQGTYCCVHSGEFHALREHHQNPNTKTQSSPDPVQQLLTVQASDQVHASPHPFVWYSLHALQFSAWLLQCKPALLHWALLGILSGTSCCHSLLFSQSRGPERDAHAVAEVARKELWGGVSCSQMQPNGHTFLGGKGARSCFCQPLWHVKI